MQKEELHKRFVKDKFDRIVRNYDLVNTLGSFGQDSFWRREVAKELSSASPPLLDLCCGPFTLSKEIHRLNPAPMFALDFSLQMLLYGVKKRAFSGLYPLCGDAENLPFKEGVFGGISIAFGLRNLVKREKALSEFYRVLKSEGVLVILEFSRPSFPIFKQVYRLYLHHFMPFLGGLLTGDKEAYKYLATSIEAFPPEEKVCEMMKRAGFSKVKANPLTLGVVTLYRGIKR